MDKEKIKRHKIWENRKKKVKNFIKYHPKIVKKNVFRFVIFQFCFLLIFVLTLYGNRELTEHNTETRTVTIESVRIDKHRSRYAWFVHLHCMIDGEEAVLYWKNDAMSYELAAERLPQEQAVTIITKPNKRLVDLKFHTEIVDIRTDDTVYHDIADVNESLKENRIWLSLVMGFVWFIYTGFTAFTLYLKFQ